MAMTVSYSVVPQQEILQKRANRQSIMHRQQASGELDFEELC